MDKIKNADDFGLSHEVNQAIVEQRFMGQIDCASLMVCTPGLDEAVQLADYYDIPVGLHLSLTTPWISYREFISCWIAGVVDEEMVYWAWDKQINKFLDTGLPLDRVDSHHGVHFFPVCWKPLMRLMKKYKIKYVRNPPRKFCWLHYNPKLWLGKNKSWTFYHINKGGTPLPYEEHICHPK